MRAMRHMRHSRLRIAIVLPLVAGAIAMAVIGFASAGDDNSLTAVTKSATGRFHDLSAAQAAGWNVLVKDKLGITCIDNQPVGGMGFHYANPKPLGDALLDAEPPHGVDKVQHCLTRRHPKRLSTRLTPPGSRSLPRSSTSCLQTPGRPPGTPVRRSSSGSRTCSTPRGTVSVSRPSGRSTSGSGIRIRPECSSPGIRGCTASRKATGWARSSCPTPGLSRST